MSNYPTLSSQEGTSTKETDVFLEALELAIGVVGLLLIAGVLVGGPMFLIWKGLAWLDKKHPPIDSR